MIKFANILRYIVAMALPLLFIGEPVVVLSFTVACLFFNNLLDDVVFYYGSCNVSLLKYHGGLPSPASGIVTGIRKDVPLFSHLQKSDCLTQEEIFGRISIPLGRRHGRYNHITIFLNKLNCHLIGDTGEESLSMRSYNFGPNEEMVEDGQLVATNSGKYLANPLVIIEYPSAFVVLTLDKYISRLQLANDTEVNYEAFICRGSQCDIYIKENFIVKVGKNVDIFESLTRGPARPLKVSHRSALSLIRQALPRGVWSLVKSNAVKTLSTFSNATIAVVTLIGLLAAFLSIYALYLPALFLYLFALVRSYKHLMYALMNVFGNHPLYHKSYALVNKISTLWQRKKQK